MGLYLLPAVQWVLLAKQKAKHKSIVQPLGIRIDALIDALIDAFILLTGGQQDGTASHDSVTTE